MEPSLAGAGTANDQYVFVDVVFWYLVPADHDSFRLCQEDIVLKFLVDEGFNILLCAP